jgi:histone H3/H4
MGLVRKAFEEDPQFSSRRASNMLEIPRATIHRILRYDLNKNPHHIQVFHKFQEEDYPRRAAMCAEVTD